MKCKFNDCGWCYSKDEQTNDTQGQCNNPQECVVNIEQNGGKMNSIETLKHHNEWRRGSDTEMLNPIELGSAIDTAIADYEAMQKQNDELRARITSLESAMNADINKTGVNFRLQAALDESPAQSLADIRAEAVIEAAENVESHGYGGHRIIKYKDLIDHANRIKEG